MDPINKLSLITAYPTDKRIDIYSRKKDGYSVSIRYKSILKDKCSDMQELTNIISKQNEKIVNLKKENNLLIEFMKKIIPDIYNNDESKKNEYLSELNEIKNIIENGLIDSEENNELKRKLIQKGNEINKLKKQKKNPDDNQSENNDSK